MTSLDDLITQYSSEIEYISTLGLDETYTENIAVDIDNAYRAIRNYIGVGKDADISEFGYIACELALIYKHLQLVNLGKLSGDRSITQQTEGSRSVTFSSNDIELDSYGLTAAIKAKLPARIYMAF